jgi:hypothetical protein
MEVVDVCISCPASRDAWRQDEAATLSTWWRVLQRSGIEQLLGRKSSGSGLKIREYGRRDPSHWPRSTLYPPKLALISPTNRGRSVGIVCLRTQATEFSFLGFFKWLLRKVSSKQFGFWWQISLHGPLNTRLSSYRLTRCSFKFAW